MSNKDQAFNGKIQLKLFPEIAYVHAITMAFVGAVKGINLIVQMKRRWRLERGELMGEKLARWRLLMRILIELIVSEVWVMVLAIKLVIIHITLIYVQFRDIDVDAEKASQPVGGKGMTEEITKGKIHQILMSK